MNGYCCYNGGLTQPEVAFYRKRAQELIAKVADAAKHPSTASDAGMKRMTDRIIDDLYRSK